MIIINDILMLNKTPVPVAHPTLRKGAKIALIILLLSVVRQFFYIYQLRDQLTSPILPDDAASAMIHPSIFIGFVSTMISVLALLIYFFEKYLMVILLIVCTIIWQLVYPFWFASSP